MNMISKHISNRTLMLILILAAFTVFFLFLALRQPAPTNTTAVVPTPTPVAQTSLKLENAPSSPSATNTKSFNITIDTSTNRVTVVQAELSFDPTAVANITITPGTFITQPVQLIKTIDYSLGRISYALGIQPQAKGIMGKGVFATIQYSILPTATGNKTLIYFLPKTTVVGAQGIAPSVVKLSEGLVIPLPNPTPRVISPTVPFVPITPVQ